MSNSNIMIAVAIIIVSAVSITIILSTRSSSAPNQTDISQTLPRVSSSPSPSVVTLSEQPIQKQALSFSLSELNNSSQSGTVRIEDVEGKALITVEIIQSASNSAQPAHIHEGKCPNPGAVKYVLSNVIDGKSVTTLKVNAEQLSKELPLAINIHKSQFDISNYVACGDIL